MTQHRWGTKDGYEAMAGWDRPMQSFFFQASKICECMNEVDCEGVPPNDCEICGGDREIWLYENLADPELSVGRMTIEQVKTKIDQYLTGCPPALYDNLMIDKANDAGNDITEYPSVGRAKVVRAVS